MDNFKGQITPRVLDLLDAHNIHHVLLPSNTTDKLQPLDIAVNKPAKQFMRNKFDHWYTEQIFEQLQGRNTEEVELLPVDLSLPVLKEMGAKWIVEMFEYISNNPQFMVNGFLKAGITQEIDEPNGSDTDGNESEEDGDIESETTDVESEGSESETADDETEDNKSEDDTN